MKNKSVKLTVDYFTIAFICILTIMGGDSKYPAALISAVCHEIGHLAVMKFYGCDDVDIKVNLFNITISDKLRGTRSYKQDAAVICAGPAVNLVMFITFGLLNRCFETELLRNISIISGILCIFNMLPILTTDGGQLVEIALSYRYSLRTVNIIMITLSVLFITPLACFAFYVLLMSQYNYTLLFSVMYLCFVTLIKIV